MTNFIGWAYPDTVEEALALLRQEDPRWEPVAGGTSWAFRSRSMATGLMDISRLPLKEISFKNNRLHLGTLVTVEQLRQSAQLRQACPLLTDMAESIRPHQIRNAVTLGGNAIQVFPWSDAPVALLAAGATFHVLDPTKDEPLQIPADEFFTLHPRKRMEGRLLSGVSLPALEPNQGNAYLKNARSRVDLALVVAAVTLRQEGGKITSARIALGALHGLPERLPEVEQALVGSSTDDLELEGRLAKLAAASVNPMHDVRVSREYRSHLAGVVVGRVVQQALARAVEG